MSSNPLIRILNESAEALKAERYMQTDPSDLAHALMGVVREVSYHFDRLGVMDPNAVDAFRQVQDVHMPAFAKSSAEVMLTGALQSKIELLACKSNDMPREERNEP